MFCDVEISSYGHRHQIRRALESSKKDKEDDDDDVDELLMINDNAEGITAENDEATFDNDINKFNQWQK